MRVTSPAAGRHPGAAVRYRPTPARPGDTAAGRPLRPTSRPHRAKAAAGATEWGVPGETDSANLLARRDVDAVCICTPSGAHATQTIAAARAGKHVLVEKPMALTVADAD